MRFDEEWSFVARKEKHCGPGEATAGDCWDHVALDPHSRRVVGKRTAAATHELVAECHRRTGGRIPWLITSDECPADAGAIRAAYGQVVPSPRTGRPGRPRNPTAVMPAGLTYAPVHKHRADGRVVRVSTTLVFGTWAGLLLALLVSAVRPEGAEELRVLEGVGRARGGHPVQPLHVQLPLVRADVAGERGRRAVATANAGDGGRTDRPRVVPP